MEVYWSVIGTYLTIKIIKFNIIITVKANIKLYSKIWTINEYAPKHLPKFNKYGDIMITIEI